MGFLDALWGPAQTGKPSYPSLDPSAYSGFDTAPLAAAAKTRIGNQAAKAREQALSRLQASGVHGADTGAALANVAGQQTDALANNEAQMSAMDYQSRLGNRDAALRKYENDLMANAGEENARSSLLAALMGTIGTIGGGYFGGPAGAMAGKTAGETLAKRGR